MAAYYVGLLLSGEDYRSIMAITFTNKATAEMSERILGYLYDIARGKEPLFLSRAREFMIRHQEASDAELAQRANECFRQMLLDYDNVRICTIDSFLQTLFSGLAGLLGLGAGLKTELDIDHVISQAVDQLLSTEMTPSDCAILEDYMLLKLDQDSKLNVHKTLCSFAKEMYNEAVQELDANDLIVFDAEAIERGRKAIEQQWQANEDLAALKEALAQCHPENYPKSDSKDSKELAAYKRLQRSVENPDKVPAKDRFSGLNNPCKAEELNRATEIANRVRRTYNTLHLTIRFSRDMQFMASLQRLIRRNLAEANCALLAKTATTLSKALKTGDADFILEKAGIRYSHILIDEFQDTSQLQWRIINQLVQDVLAGEGHTLLIVGDIKQSIYRWRNGDWHIMAELGKDESHYSALVNPAFKPLVRNFRSSERVVDFNLSLFRHIIETYPYEEEKALVEAIYDEGFTGENLSDFYQADKKRCGFVRFRAFPYRTPERNKTNAMLLDMFDTMEQLLQQGAKPSDFMVLVRKNDQAIRITTQHADLDPEQYPLLSQAHFVSPDSFLLEASQDVQTLIKALQFMATDDEVAAKYVEMVTGKTDIKAQIKASMSRKTPLYEAVSELVTLLFTNEDGQYKGSETAYINSLLDYTRSYVGAHGSNLQDFLAYWEDSLHEKPIPASSEDAIRILTVHKSKGLQAQTLFVPLCNWSPKSGNKIWCQVADEVSEERKDYVPIPEGNEMKESAYQKECEREQINMRIDELNMLYVALTRAEDNLYVSADFSVTQKGLGTVNHVGKNLLYFTELNGEVTSESLPVTANGDMYAEYAVGEPVSKRPQESPDVAKKEDKPFSFAGVPALDAELWSNSDQVRFVQSQEGALYTDYGDEAYRRVARMDEGTLCHEIFAHLRKADELEHVLDEFRSRGEIKDDEQYEELKRLISSAWQGSPEMRDWFTAPWVLKLEEPIYMDHRELRPDRVMINPETNEAVVLDYKFGIWEDKYTRQVGEYKEALCRMGYRNVRGYLWFARKNKLVEVKN